MPYRTRKEVKQYRRHIESVHTKTSCIFCDIKQGDEQYILDTKSFKVLRNIFPYSQWDQQNVSDHLMIVPKKHVDSLGNLSAHEASEFMTILGSYESQGYNVYARAADNRFKSVTHQHTHLIKLCGKPRRFLIYIRKPYISIGR